MVVLVLLTFSVQLALGASNEAAGNNDVDISDQITEDLSPDRDVDPFRSINKVIHDFNSVVDKILLRPLAKGYKTITPKFMQSGVRNLFANLGDVNNSVNNLLQGKVKAGVSDVGRILITPPSA